VEHLQSMDETIDDLLIICQKNGGVLAWHYSMVLIRTLTRQVFRPTVLFRNRTGFGLSP
jgi:hypothetical protein